MKFEEFVYYINNIAKYERRIIQKNLEFIYYSGESFEIWSL